jgi:hypothetical protein
LKLVSVTEALTSRDAWVVSARRGRIHPETRDKRKQVRARKACLDMGYSIERLFGVPWGTIRSRAFGWGVLRA